MIVNDLDSIGVSFAPFEPQARLPVNSDTELTFAVALQLFEPISQHCQIGEARRRIQNSEEFFGSVLDGLELSADKEAEVLSPFPYPGRIESSNPSILCEASYAVRIAKRMLPWNVL